MYVTVDLSYASLCYWEVLQWLLFVCPPVWIGAGSIVIACGASTLEDFLQHSTPGFPTRIYSSISHNFVCLYYNCLYLIFYSSCLDWCRVNSHCLWSIYSRGFLMIFYSCTSFVFLLYDFLQFRVSTIYYNCLFITFHSSHLECCRVNSHCLWSIFSSKRISNNFPPYI